ncbi:hypothetical protein [Phytohabitans houttuyneae]|uniref:Uncharacterized protein n=1 Tax=Phytohabitans houttuyneae TaxID=1076126 RepID=A0A6V8KQ18_9ACTN|nr:hypothetical protein [Phytohabitans houttuyneae]GFJ82755.1 hypothetical protein Phou_069350 [Phytohabitans houttuyneae]
MIGYFDRLAEAHAGLEAIVRGAAVLAGCPAGLADPGRRVRVRVTGDGHRDDRGGTPHPDWVTTPLVPDGSSVLWLERGGDRGALDAMILERAAVAARAALDRTRGGRRHPRTRPSSSSSSTPRRRSPRAWAPPAGWACPPPRRPARSRWPTAPRW